MKLLTAITTTTLVAASLAMGAVSAADKEVPELLGVLSAGEIEAMSIDESSTTRGERVTVTYGYRPGLCGWKPCLKPLKKTITIEAGRRGGPSYFVKH